MPVGSQLVALIFSLAISFAGAGLGAYFTNPNSDWFRTLVKPEWMPANSVFAPVWIVIYALMGISVWLVWREGGWVDNGNLMVLFGAQLVFNIFWSAVFFGLHSIGFALFLLIVTTLMAAALTVSFWRVSRVAGFILIPYVLWLIYACAINLAIYQLNPKG